MRTTLDLDDELLAEVMKETGKKSKKAAIEAGLGEYVRARKRKALIEMIGSGAIDMTLDELFRMRGCDKAREETERLQRQQVNA